MATGHFFKTHLSPGAPPLNNAPGSLIAVLDWALDVATGTHWQKVFTGTNLAVYRATTGERRYLRVFDPNGTQAQVRAYETMSDASTGTGAFPSTAQRTVSTYFVYKSSDATPRSYAIVGDSRFFLLTPEPAGNNISFKLAFGETSSFDPIDNYRTVIWASADIAWQYYATGALTTSLVRANVGLPASTMYYARTADGVNASRAAILDLGYAHISERFPTSRSVVWRRDEAKIYENETGVVAGMHLRGVVPYMSTVDVGVDATLLPLHSYQDFDTSQFYTLIGDDAGRVVFLRVTNDEPGRV